MTDAQGQVPLFTPTREEQAIDAAIDAARRELTATEDVCAQARFKAIRMADNHQHVLLSRTQKERDTTVARQIRLSVDRFRHIRSDFFRTLREQGMEAAYLGLAKEKPGPKKGSRLSLDSWEKDFIKQEWEDSKHLRSRRQIWKRLCAHRHRLAEKIGAAYCYGPDPSRDTVARFINSELGGNANPKRQSAQAIKILAGFIPRHYEDEYATDSWCVDEWEIDCYCYRDDDHRVVYNWGTKNPLDGRSNPVLHVLTVIDQRSAFVLDWIVTDDLQDDTLTLAERILRNGFPVPLRLVADRASHFRQLSYGHMQRRNMGELIDALEGPLGRLGTPLRSSPEKNPRANREERAVHREYARFAQRDFGLAWRPPLKSGLREVTGIDARVEAHYRYHCGGARNSERAGEPSELIPVSYVIGCVARWVDEINNASTDANGCHGLTRLAAFRCFQPPCEEITARRPLQSAIDDVFAEHFKRTVPEHSMLNIDGDWYDGLELASHVGEEVEIKRYRRDLEQVFVYCEGGPPIIAQRKPRVGIHDDKLLAQEAEKLARRRKALAATGIIPLLGTSAESPNPDLTVHVSLASPPAQEMTEAQGRDYQRRRTVEETADEFVRRERE